MKIVFLDAGTFYEHPNLMELLSPYGEVILYSNTQSQDVIERVRMADIVLTNKVVLDGHLFSKCPRLKLVCVTATGTNNIDLDAAQKYGITVKNASNYSTHSVAQTTLAMVLHLLMRFQSHDDFVRNHYVHHFFFTHLTPGFSEVCGKTWGIIGLGNIGKQVAMLAKALGAKVVYHSPSGKEQKVDYDCLSLKELMGMSDIISIHTPLTPTTKNLIGEKELAACKRSAILVNVARGGIVDEQALANSLNNNMLLGAAVDVFSTEPILSNNPLFSVIDKDKLLLTPHLAWGSKEARARLMEIVCGNIKQFIEGALPQNQ